MLGVRSARPCLELISFVQQHGEYLELVRRVLEQLRQILARYTVLAASLDENYQKNSPLSPQLDVSRLGKTLVIDDIGAAAGPPSFIRVQDEGVDNKNVEHSVATTVVADAKKPDAPWYARLLPSKGTNKLPLKKASLTTAGCRLHPGVAWWFKKDQLAETLAEFTDWNKRLGHLVGPLMAGFGFNGNEALQNRLQSDGKKNIFQGLLELSRLSDALDGGAEASKGA